MMSRWVSTTSLYICVHSHSLQRPASDIKLLKELWGWGAIHPCSSFCVWWGHFYEWLYMLYTDIYQNISLECRYCRDPSMRRSFTPYNFSRKTFRPRYMPKWHLHPRDGQRRNHNVVNNTSASWMCAMLVPRCDGVRRDFFLLLLLLLFLELRDNFYFSTERHGWVTMSRKMKEKKFIFPLGVTNLHLESMGMLSSVREKSWGESFPTIAVCSDIP